MEKFRISVRSLVEFLLHSGDIDGGKGAMADKVNKYFFITMPPLFFADLHILPVTLLVISRYHTTPV